MDNNMDYLVDESIVDKVATVVGDDYGEKYTIAPIAHIKLLKPFWQYVTGEQQSAGDVWREKVYWDNGCSGYGPQGFIAPEIIAPKNAEYLIVDIRVSEDGEDVPVEHHLVPLSDDDTWSVINLYMAMAGKQNGDARDSPTALVERWCAAGFVQALKQ